MRIVYPVAWLLFGAALGGQTGSRPDLTLGDFEESTFVQWTATGAFGPAPYRPGNEQKLKGVHGSGLAWSGASGVAGTGMLVSAPFTVARRYMSFLVTGYRDYPAELGLELVVDGRVVRSSAATDRNEPVLRWRTWDVAELAGRRAQIRVNDQSTVGSVAVDLIVQTDEPRSAPIDATRRLNETYRPQFHFTPLAHWMNDPNGLLYYRGDWHLFHQQTYPGAPATVWGHAVSRDLFGWKHRPVALSTDNLDANFSGSGLVDFDNASGLKQGTHNPLLLFYTLHPLGPDRDAKKATQCLAFSTDGGVTFRKFEGNPLLRTPDRNDRDPKVFYHKPSKAWFMLLSLSANNSNREQARYGLFRARDLKSWELIQTFGPDGWFWECPDMFELPVDGDPTRSKWLLLKSSSDYIVGSFDGDRFQPESDRIKVLWGRYLYATQTFSDAPSGRRVQLGWMNTGRPWLVDAYPGMPFNQQLGVPRELTLRTTAEGPRLFRYPVKEIEALRVKKHQWRERPIAPGQNLLAGIHHDLLDIDLDIELQNARRVRLNLRGEEVLYDVGQQKLLMRDGKAPLPSVENRIRLRVLLDRTSVEAFGNDGQSDLSVVFFPAPLNRTVSLTVEGGQARIRRLEVHELRSGFSSK
jgi:sucrose-6-phosphate hydrolase SacC (GH32 family)